MPKSKYRFNKLTLQYEKVRITFKTILLRIISIFSSGLAMAALIILLAYNFLDSPRERMLKREIEQYKLQFEILNDRLDKLIPVVEDLQDRDDNIYRVIFEADPIPASVRQAGYGGSDRYAHLEGYDNSGLVIETVRKIDRITSQLYVQSKSFDEVFEMARNKAQMLACIPAIQPMENTDLKKISSYFGYRTDPIYKVTKFHQGIDYTTPLRTKIYATGDGVVADVIYAYHGYGNTVLIDHGYGYQTLYAHCDQFKVHKGQRVKRGQLIALSGNTGKSVAPHLHYEVHKNGTAVNPIYFFFNDLTPEAYEKILVLSSRPSQTLD
jgi:murein DD-endopeptidase MepM/ murein hydrolase activator NlpD